jgi:hypothetical protein
MVDDVQATEYTLASTDLPEEVKQLIEADKAPKQVKIRVLEDGTIQAYDRFAEIWLEASSSNWFANRSTSGLHLSSRSRGTEKSYRAQAAGMVKDGSRTIKVRGTAKTATATDPMIKELAKINPAPDAVRTIADRGPVPYVEPVAKPKRSRARKAS